MTTWPRKLGPADVLQEWKISTTFAPGLNPRRFGRRAARSPLITTLYAMRILIQVAVLLGFLGIGELIAMISGLPVPSSVIGMLLLAASLKAGIVKLRHVEGVADFMVHNIALFFVPAGVGLMNSFGILAAQWLPIVGAVAGSTFVIIAVTGWVHKLSRRALSSVSPAGRRDAAGSAQS